MKLENMQRVKAGPEKSTIYSLSYVDPSFKLLFCVLSEYVDTRKLERGNCVERCIKGAEIVDYR